MKMFSTLFSTLLVAQLAHCLGGGPSENPVFTYQTSSTSSELKADLVSATLKGSTYQLTGFGASESTIDFHSNGSLIYTPAITASGVGYAQSDDYGKTFYIVYPSGLPQTKSQAVFKVADGRYFFWSTAGSGINMVASDDEGASWAAKNTFKESFDWAKLLAGKPVFSKLSSDARQILYFSAPSPISTPVDETFGPVKQLIYKSLDKGTTWQKTKGTITLNATLSGGACAELPEDIRQKEYIIFSDGLVRPNGTVLLTLRRCRSLSVAMSDDEGDSWSLYDVPDSNVVPFDKGLATWVSNGNVLLANPLSQDSEGNLYAVWVDKDLVLRLSKSKDGIKWSSPVAISPPTVNGLVRSYHPTVTHHPTIPGRAAIAFYGSADNATWDGYIIETADIRSASPVWNGVIVNPKSKPLQANKNKLWDQGYGNPAGDLIEFSDVKYHPKTGDLVAAFAIKMCTATVGVGFDYTSCDKDWDAAKRGQAAWQGFLGFGTH